MRKPEEKKVMLDAMREVQLQYLQGTHVNKIMCCPLCCQYFENYTCKQCPMYVFHPAKLFSSGCMYRKCKPVHMVIDSTQLSLLSKPIGINYDARDVRKVIEFYEEAINKIENMSNFRFKFTNFRFLKKIDKRIAKRYGN